LYFRTTNFDAELSLKTNASNSVKSSRSVIWNATYKNFDSPKGVHVTRFDIFHETDGTRFTARLGGDKGMLSLPNGPAYIFSTVDKLTIVDTVTGKSYTATTEDPVWLSEGSCVHLDAANEAKRRERGNMTLMVVSSGPIEPTLSALNDSKSCKESTMRIGYDSLHNNPVDYVPSGKCRNPLSGPGGAADFDDLDEPIRPLQSHYHTRSALYYTVRGSSSFNDAHEEPVTSGEMRFVSQGHFYGPETMWERDYYVASLHEADPTARSTKPSNPPHGFQPCPFACLDIVDNKRVDKKDLMKCVLKK